MGGDLDGNTGQCHDADGGKQRQDNDHQRQEHSGNPAEHDKQQDGHGDNSQYHELAHIGHHTALEEMRDHR